MHAGTHTITAGCTDIYSDMTAANRKPVQSITRILAAGKVIQDGTAHLEEQDRW